MVWLFNWHRSISAGMKKGTKDTFSHFRLWENQLGCISLFYKMRYDFKNFIKCHLFFSCYSQKLICYYWSRKIHHCELLHISPFCLPGFWNCPFNFSRIWKKVVYYLSSSLFPIFKQLIPMFVLSSIWSCFIWEGSPCQLGPILAPQWSKLGSFCESTRVWLVRSAHQVCSKPGYQVRNTSFWHSMIYGCRKANANTRPPSTGSPASQGVEEGTGEIPDVFESWMEPRMSWL